MLVQFDPTGNLTVGQTPHRKFLKQNSCQPGYAFVMTNAISTTANMTTTTLKPRLHLRPVDELLVRRVHPALQSARPVGVRQPLRAAKARPAMKSAWASPLRESFTEKLLYAAIALSALAGIAYCFMSVLERVQSWPVFNAWVSRVLGA